MHDKLIGNTNSSVYARFELIILLQLPIYLYIHYAFEHHSKIKPIVLKILGN